ncbi:MAG: GNAT family N-acetyltransferase [Candidatus Binataceae bacterium]
MASRNSHRKAARLRAVRVRRARISDVPAIRELYRQLHLDNYRDTLASPAKMRREFSRLNRDPRHHLLIAKTGGRIVGTTHVIVVPHLGHGLRPFAVVENVVVDESCRTSGVGRALMAAAGRIARRHRCYKLSLTTNLKRRGAHRFYERLGWRRSHFGYSLGLE